ncbi:hypothetical protein Emed_000703 [Eimeria media]
MPQLLQRQQQERESQQDQQQLLLQAVRDIHEAEFIAVDLGLGVYSMASPSRHEAKHLELLSVWTSDLFTGLLLGPPSSPVSLQSYFEKCHEAAKAFLAPQIGICCVRRDKENPKRWLLHPYTFDAHPRVVMSLELRVHSLDYERLCEVQQQQQESLEALQQRLQQKGVKPRSSNRSGDDGTAQGAAGSRLAAAECEEALSAGSKQVLEDVGDVAAQPRELTNAKAEEQSTGDKSSSEVGGLSVLAGALIESGAPLVFHNGLLDLLHLLEKFVEEVPPTLEAFAAEVCRLFIGGVFDTKYIATHLTPGSVFGRTALQALRNHLLASPGLLCCFDIAESCKGRFNFSFKELNVANELPETRSHEAGFDALATAQVFVCLAAAVAKQQQQDVCLSLLREGRDVIGVAGVKPGYLRLRSFLPEETSPLLSQSSDSRNDSSNDKETEDRENGCSGRNATKSKTNKRDRHCSDSPPSLCAVPDAATGAAAPASGETAEPPVTRASRRIRVTP